MLTASHLVRQVGERVAVEDVTFDVKAGEVFGLLGPNGAGKTTTLRMLGGLIPPTSGEVRIGSVAIDRRTGGALRARIGFLTETPGLWGSAGRYSGGAFGSALPDQGRWPRSSR